jgi:hypothetical protein
MLVKRSFLQMIFPSNDLSKIAVKEKRVVPLNTKDYRYLRFRAIGNLEVDKPKGGFNSNWDGFPYKYFEDDEPGYGYKSFVGKRAHYEHNSKLGDKGAIGELIDAYLNRFIYPDDVGRWSDLDGKDNAEKRLKILSIPNQKDGSIEVLMKIDTTLLGKKILEPEVERALERIIKMIDTGQKLFCSMGTNVEYSICSVCGNKARFASDYCDHMKPIRKGAITVVSANNIRDLLDKDLLRPEWLKHVVVSKRDVDEVLNGISNKGVAVRNGEINHKLSFFELSIVKSPAYEVAKALEKISSQNDMEYKDYLRYVRNMIGDDVLLDIYSLLQEEGIVSKGCEVKW